MILPISLLILLVRLCDTLIGYDCEIPFGNGTTVSLLEPDACGPHDGAPVLRDVYVELLHHPRFIDVTILSCRIEIDHVINKSSHKNTRVEPNNKRHYFPITLPSCRYLHAYGELQLGNFSFRNLTARKVNSRSIPLDEGNDDIPSRQETAAANTYVHITFKQYTVKVDTLINKISLPIGTACVYTNLECTDEEGYQNFWSPVFYEGCEQLSQSIIYRGIAKGLQSAGQSDAYALHYGNGQILLFVRTQHDACNITVFQTEHPRLVLREISYEYMKSKKIVNKLRSIVYHHTYNYISNNNSQNVRDAYLSVSLNKCTKREMELRTSIAIVDKDPSLLAYTLMGTPGYTARVRGEAAQLLRCTPVPARLRPTGTCFRELPVTINEKPMYLQPKTRIITTKGTEIACDPLTAAMYRIKSQWYTLTPEAVKIMTAPSTLRPGSLSWGRDLATHTSNLTKEPEDDAQTEQLLEEKASTDANRDTYYNIAMITVVCITATLILLAVTQRLHRCSFTRSQSRDPVFTLLRPPCRMPEDDADSTRGTARDNCSHHLETLNRMREDHSDLSNEVSNLKDAYRDLELRINHCTSPMQAGLDRLAVTALHRRSKLNEGGVTYGASA